MNTGELNGYINGLFDISSSVSVWAGPSYVAAKVFDNGDFPVSFYEWYKLDPDVLLKTDMTFEELLKEWFGDEEKSDKKIVQSLLYHTEKLLGKAELIYSVKEDFLSNLEDENSPVPFSFVEDMAAVRFEKYTVCFVMGNNE